MANFANSENQQISKVLGIWHNGEFGKFRKTTDQQRSLVHPFNGELGKFGKSTEQQSFWYPFINVWDWGIWKINGVLVLWYFGEFGKSADQYSFRHMK